MLGGLGSWVTTGLLGSIGSLAPRGTGDQDRSTLTGAPPHRQRPQRRSCARVTLIVAWARALSMDARALRVACGDGGVVGHAKASRTRPAGAHARAVRGRELLEQSRHSLKRMSAHAHDQARVRPATAGRLAMTGPVFQ